MASVPGPRPSGPPGKPTAAPPTGSRAGSRAGRADRARRSPRERTARHGGRPGHCGGQRQWPRIVFGAVGIQLPAQVAESLARRMCLQRPPPCPGAVQAALRLADSVQVAGRCRRVSPAGYGHGRGLAAPPAGLRRCAAKMMVEALPCPRMLHRRRATAIVEAWLRPDTGWHRHTTVPLVMPAVWWLTLNSAFSNRALTMCEPFL